MAGVEINCPLHFLFQEKKCLAGRKMFFLHRDVISLLDYKQAATGNVAHLYHIPQDNFVCGEIHHFSL